MSNPKPCLCGHALRDHAGYGCRAERFGRRCDCEVYLRESLFDTGPVGKRRYRLHREWRLAWETFPGLCDDWPLSDGGFLLFRSLRIGPLQVTWRMRVP